MPSISPYDAREVSNFILKIAHNRGTQITQMSLLKIIFYAHGWYLATNDKPLFRQPVEAWEFGPVVKVVRDAFKGFGRNPITSFAERLDLESGEFTQVSASLSNEDEKFVETIFDNYSKYSAFTLSDMTHEKDSPWDKVWNTNKTIGRLGLRIKNEEIREYFLNIKDSDTMH
jgi:uncharacterized phage-associated protein